MLFWNMPYNGRLKNCIETTGEMVTTIKIVKCDENSLQLDFNGEIRIFEK